VVHVQWLIKPRVEAALLPLLARALRARLVYTAHNVLPHEPRPGDREAFGALYERCDAVIVHTEKSRRELLRTFPEIPGAKVGVIPHGNHEYRLTEALGPEEAKAELGIDPDRLLVAFAGKIRPYKGLASLLDAWERSVASRSADLLIAGHPDDPDHHEELEAHVRARGLVGVHFLPKYLSDHEMQLVLRGADAMVLPYLAIDQSGILLFAMTAGRPIVASRLESFVEVFEDGAGALFHEPGDAQGLAAALDRVVGDHELRARMGRTSREIAVRNHSWPDIARATTALYPS
jgi:glycosyltransferase involved in cell wall biosynthesis